MTGPVRDPNRERFTAHLRRVAEPVWRAQHDHPFVRGIGDGSLDLERFRHWVRQDYRFLVEYCRLFGLAAARAPDLDTLVRFADLLQATARTEMDLHRAYAAELGIAPAALEAGADGAHHARVHRLPGAGRRHRRLRRAGGGPPALHVGVLGDRPDPRRAGRCPPSRATRSGCGCTPIPTSRRSPDWCRGLVDRLAAGADRATRARMEESFLISSRYEYLFWEMAWSLETWPV